MPEVTRRTTVRTTDSFENGRVVEPGYSALVTVRSRETVTEHVVETDSLPERSGQVIIHVPERREWFSLESEGI